jgi:hypothetical protein
MVVSGRVHSALLPSIIRASSGPTRHPSPKKQRGQFSRDYLWDTNAILVTKVSSLSRIPSDLTHVQDALDALIEACASALRIAPQRRSNNRYSRTSRSSYPCETPTRPSRSLPPLSSARLTRCNCVRIRRQSGGPGTAKPDAPKPTCRSGGFENHSTANTPKLRRSRHCEAVTRPDPRAALVISEITARRIRRHSGGPGIAKPRRAQAGPCPPFSSARLPRCNCVRIRRQSGGPGISKP